MAIITDEKKIDEILTRGVENIFPNKEEFKKVLMSGKKIKLYCGYDPTSPSLHIGNAISINKLGQFQELGHEVIFLIGDFTGMIGDPTDKSATRKKLSRKEALKNSTNYKKQASPFLKFSGKNKARVVYNSKWSDKLTFKDLIEISSNFTVQQMIQRDMFQQRLKEEKPIYLHEFLYPLAQGYDSVTMDVDLEIGGNDQTFNMLCGRDLMRAMKGKEKFVLTMKLLADETGKKMGKTEGNIINLNETPENMFGQVMAWSDGLILSGFELCTNIQTEEINKIKEDLKNPNNNPRDIKIKLAYEITKINHGEKKAKEAEENFIKTFQKKEIPDSIEEIFCGVGELISDVLVKNKVLISKGEWRRLVLENAVHDLVKNQNITDQNIKTSNNLTLKIGKRRFIKIIIK
jgi:tyrosyl-tRNA synthetase